MELSTNKRVIFGIFCLLFIFLSLLRGSEQLFSYEHPLIDRELFGLHISPKFRPFTKTGDYENTRHIARVYIEHPDTGYQLINPSRTAKEIGGPHAAKVVIYSGVIELPTKIIRGQLEASNAVIRKLYCENTDNSGVKIDVLNRYTGALSYKHYVPCN